MNLSLRLLALLATLLPIPLLAAESPAKKFNVLFIASDDLRNDPGCYGHPIVKSPNLDRLAGRSMIFDRAFTQQAVCNPSRASLMTGLRPDTLCIWDLPTHFRQTKPDVVTLPQHFKQQGYFTQNIGKIFHNWVQIIEGDPVSWSVPAKLHFNSHGNDKPEVAGDIPPNLNNSFKCEMRDVPDEAYFDGRVAAESVKVLGELSKRDQPFFLAVGFWKPHSPFNAPKKYWDFYPAEKVDMPANPEWPIDAPRVAWHNSREILSDPPRTLTAEDVRQMRRGYYANISYMDAQLGKVLDELERLKLAGRTIIVFWSDHGYHLGEQSLWAKTSNFELDSRVPLMISVPGLKPGRTGSVAELLDMYPTLVDLCGLPPVAALEGKSLVPVLKDPAAKVKDFAITQHPRPAYYKGHPDSMGVSLRTEQWRYTEWRDWASGKVIATELYDHQSDPKETRNVAADHPEVVRGLAPKMPPHVNRILVEVDSHEDAKKKMKAKIKKKAKDQN